MESAVTSSVGFGALQSRDATEPTAIVEVRRRTAVAEDVEEMTLVSAYPASSP